MTLDDQLIDASVSPFNKTQRQQLKALSNVRLNKNYSAAPNTELEEYIQTLRDMYPDKFRTTRADLSARVFFDEPTSVIVYARVIRPLSRSPYLKKR
jgi:hypothetical protein